MNVIHHSADLPALRVIVRGWNFDAWNDGFYPDDLPADWRLDYYANECRGVLVPDGVWREAAMGRLETWFGDLPEHFDMYLEISAEVPAHLAVALKAALPAGRLKGIVLGDATLDLPDWGVPVYVDQDDADSRETDTGSLCCWRPERGRSDGVGLIEATLGGAPAPRVLREQLEAFLRASRGRPQATLIVTGAPPSFAARRDLEVMGQLLGA